MTTLAEARTKLGRVLRDTDATSPTFDVAARNDLIASALVEVGRIAPQRFQEDITPVANVISYPLRAGVLPSGTPEIEVRRVEFWDNSQTPARAVFLVRKAATEPSHASFAGWEVWNGVLTLTNYAADFLDPTRHVIRVWGYSPYPPVSNDADTLPVSVAAEEALLAYARVEALRRLRVERDLFTQWQSQPNNSDVSPAGLLAALNSAEDEWRRRGRALLIVR